jgi:hypothetical protein
MEPLPYSQTNSHTTRLLASNWANRGSALAWLMTRRARATSRSADNPVSDRGPAGLHTSMWTLPSARGPLAVPPHSHAGQLDRCGADRQ